MCTTYCEGEGGRELGGGGGWVHVIQNSLTRSYKPDTYAVSSFKVKEREGVGERERMDF